jgi:peptide-methionine (S)-S-oxide reductase
MPMSPDGIVESAMKFVSGVFAAAIAAFSAAGDGANAQPKSGAATAVFAGGCFWCTESDFEKLEGVKEAVSGYTGGMLENPTYENYSGHVEAVEVTYDPGVVSYRALVDYHLRHIDPFDDGGQFCDRGPQYTTAIFVGDDQERAAAEAAIAEAEKILGERIVTPVRPRERFWVAEDYHQNYYKTHPLRYRLYRTGCGRDARVKEVWRGR